MPRMDADTCFARLLDWNRGGYCQISPFGEYVSERRYLDGTMILETRFRTDSGEARLFDFFAMDPEEPEHVHYKLIRIIEGLSGIIDFAIEICPRFGYGEIIPYIRRESNGAYSAKGSN